MALIKCSECGKDVSDKASSCPNCGNPIGVGNKATVVQIDSAPSKRRKYRIWLLVFTPMFFVGSFFSLIWGLAGGDGQFGIWLFVAILGFVGMCVSAIGSWLAKP